jgi:hypothetical protein
MTKGFNIHHPSEKKDTFENDGVRLSDIGNIYILIYIYIYIYTYIKNIHISNLLSKLLEYIKK